MNTIYLVTLEPLETRYTAQWKRWIPGYLKNHFNVVEIDGTITKNQTTDSSRTVSSKNFLDPNNTNIWKSEQIEKISLLFEKGKIKEGDRFLFYDAWHYGIIALRYMSELNSIPVRIYGLWHAGSYDEYDLLGRSSAFFTHFEISLFHCLNKSFVATMFHKGLINQKLGKFIDMEKVRVTGFPYNFSELDGYKGLPKNDIIIFPHRLSSEKQVDMVKDISTYYHVIFSQEMNPTKEEYHNMLTNAKIVLSCSLQETWGICSFEGLYLSTIPVVPDRLSYSEIYFPQFRYLSEWTLNMQNYYKYKKNLLDLISYFFSHYDNYISLMEVNFETIKSVYCTFDHILKEILNDKIYT